jgi:hypothetical protein
MFMIKITFICAGLSLNLIWGLFDECYFFIIHVLFMKCLNLEMNFILMVI